MCSNCMDTQASSLAAEEGPCIQMTHAACSVFFLNFLKRRAPRAFEESDPILATPDL